MHLKNSVVPLHPLESAVLGLATRCNRIGKNQCFVGHLPWLESQCVPFFIVLWPWTYHLISLSLSLSKETEVKNNCPKMQKDAVNSGETWRQFFVPGNARNCGGHPLVSGSSSRCWYCNVILGYEQRTSILKVKLPSCMVIISIDHCRWATICHVGKANWRWRDPALPHSPPVIILGCSVHLWTHYSSYLNICIHTKVCQ